MESLKGGLAHAIATVLTRHGKTSADNAVEFPSGDVRQVYVKDGAAVGYNGTATLSVQYLFTSVDSLAALLGKVVAETGDDGKSVREYFSLTYVSRDDLEAKGYDVSGVTDQDMAYIAKSINKGILEEQYWLSLDCAAEYLGIPKAGEEDEEDN